MTRQLRFVLRLAAVLGAAMIVLIFAEDAANAVARTPTITGNAWVALLIIAVLVVTIYMLIMGTLHVEKRDARLGGRRRTDDGWFGIFPSGAGDDEDSPDFHHHHGGGGDGGEGGGEGGG